MENPSEKSIWYKSLNIASKISLIKVVFGFFLRQSLRITVKCRISRNYSEEVERQADRYSSVETLYKAM